MTRSERHGIIVGGGIGGLTAALALRRVGVRCKVFEGAPKIEPVGAGISLWSNAMQALGQFGVGDRIAHLGTRLRAGHVLTDSGRRIFRTDYCAMVIADAPPSVCIHRGDLHRVLLEEMGAEDLRTGARCTSVEVGEGNATAHFADGSHELTELLIGADGINSAVRSSLFGNRPTRSSGCVAWRGICEYSNDELSRGETVLTIAQGGKHGLFPCGKNRAYWFAIAKKPQDETVTSDGHKLHALQLVEGWRGPAADAIQATPDVNVLRNDIEDRPPAWPWGKGCVTLLGDSIHSTTPHLGQGACQAIESAIALAASLRSRTSVIDALRTYESGRRERTAMVTNKSERIGKTLLLRNKAMVALRNFAMQTPFATWQTQRLFRELLTYCSPTL